MVRDRCIRSCTRSAVRLLFWQPSCSSASSRSQFELQPKFHITSSSSLVGMREGLCSFRRIDPFCALRERSPKVSISRLSRACAPVETLLFGARGETIAAIKLAAVLERKQATVVVYDYCLSACASYFFIATDRTYVVKGSIVAWHDTTFGAFDCSNVVKVETPYGDQWQLVRSPCAKYLQGDQTAFWQAEAMRRNFHARRTIKGQIHDTPQSIYVRKALVWIYGTSGKYPELLWMWNPRYFKAALKTQVTYEAYPETQEEVDNLARRFGIGRILHDP
jgi:hypothetical protein